MSSQFTSNSLAFPGTTIRIKPVEGFPTLSYSESSITAVEKFLIASSDILKFINAVMPLVDLDLLTYRMPAERGVLGALPLRATGMNFEPQDVGLPGNPFGRDTRSGIPAKTYCENYYVTITYTVTNEGGSDDDQTDPSSSDTFSYHSMTGSGQTQTISPTQIEVVETDSGPLDQDADGNVNTAALRRSTEHNLLQPIVRLIPTVEHTIRFKPSDADDIDWSKLITNLGRVNSSKMSTYTNTPLAKAPKQTLLFTGFSANQQYTMTVDSDGNSSWATKWERELHISQRHIVDGSKIRTWNHYWTKEGWRIATQTIPGGGRRPAYRTANFDDLLANKTA